MEKKTYKNTGSSTRTWPHIQTESGTTLELAPDEIVSLSLPDDFDDLYLKVVTPKPTRHAKVDSELLHEDEAHGLVTESNTEDLIASADDKVSTTKPKKES